MHLIISNFFIGLLLFSSVVFAQDEDSQYVLIESQSIMVNTIVKDFGIIYQNEKTTFKFRLKNLNEEPLVIWHVTTSCGCTSPSWTEKPVNEGLEAIVKIKYDSSEIGEFNKSIFVYTKFTDKPIKLSITGTVVKSKSNIEITKRNTNFNSQIPSNK